jgi:2'-5' RNA ligase
MFLQPFRLRHISTPATTMPPHISLFGPFKDMVSIDQSVIHALKEITDSFPRFHFILRKTGCFPNIQVLYLEPEPVAPFQALHRAICTKFPEVVPDFSDPVMHLTLARVNNGELGKAEAEFHKEFGERLPIEAIATEVGIYEKRNNVWRQQVSWALP